MLLSLTKKMYLKLRSQCEKFMPVYFVMADGAYLSSKFDLMCAVRQNPYQLDDVKIITTTQGKGRHHQGSVESKGEINRTA